MRDIKARAWDKLNNKFVYFNISNSSQADLEGLGIFANIEKQLFTGCQDKNNVDVYEGDILEVYRELKVIKWDEVIAGFSWRSCSMDNYLMFRKYMAVNCEIKGNIQENPDLITS